ncbi:MAG: arsenate reductase ArsC [Pseudomonadota bacterium]|nr:arsenate reductase ArsC [Pseudomonadota bacterium]
MPKKIKILFLCTGNSCRSQMAEAWARFLKNDSIKAYSAGITAHGLNPDAITVMQESGLNCSGWRSKTTTELPPEITFDYVITLCDNASQSCPFFPATTALIHKGFDDPPQLARQATNERERLAPYRRVRDELKTFILSLPESLPKL